MNLDEFHRIIKRMDVLLTEREVGISSWWIMLRNLMKELSDAIRIFDES